MANIPVTSPILEYQSQKQEIERAIQRVLESGVYILGEEVKKFEEEFAAFIGSSYCVGVASGTDAITVSLLALGIGRGDEVITPSHTSVATIVAIERTGAIPVLADIEAKSRCICPDSIARLIGSSTKAIVPVHIYGQPASLGKILPLAEKHKLYVVEDCAQAVGAYYSGKHVGNFGHLGAFSFYPTKNLGALGDAGAVVTKSRELYDRVLLLRQYGWKTKQIASISGTLNSRLDELQAAVLRTKLLHLPGKLSRRIQNAKILSNACAGNITAPETIEDTVHAFHLFVIEVDEPDNLQNYLLRNGIESAKHYPLPVHRQPAYSCLKADTMEHTDRLYKRILTIPLFPEMSEEMINPICSTLSSWNKSA